MPLLKTILLWGMLSTTSLWAQSFYVLTGVDSYDAIVANQSSKTAKYTADIKSLMQSMSKEIGISTAAHSSRVLALVIRDVSLGSSVGLEVKLELGEYVLREGEYPKGLWCDV